MIPTGTMGTSLLMASNAARNKPARVSVQTALSFRVNYQRLPVRQQLHRRSAGAPVKFTLGYGESPEICPPANR